MAYDVNYNFKETKSNKMKTISALTDYFVNRIDQSQDLKRFLHYNNLAPLSSSSKDLSGATIQQPDITISLEEINIYNNMFLESMIGDARNYIFVYSPMGKFRSTVGDVYINVDILIPSKYNKLKYGDEKRITQISNTILDIFDEYTIENSESVYEKVGNPTIKFNTFKQGRLTKTNDYIVMSLEFSINAISMRS